MKKPLQLFLTFFKIGAFTLGGGYAMLSLVEKAVVDQKKWIPSDEFWDMIAVVQSLPGVFAVNTALYVGHRVAGTKGAFAAMFGAIIPSITIILLLATVFREYRDQPVVERIFKGIRPCVVALILAPGVFDLVVQNPAYLRCPHRHRGKSDLCDYHWTEDRRRRTEDERRRTKD